MRTWAVISAVLILGWVSSRAEEIVGKPAPEWRLTNWINSPPISLSDLRGKVVLVRWWTAPGCPYCSATAPSLREFARKYREQGLEIIAIYHHKSDEPLEPKTVRRFARQYGLEFPVAIDPDWNTLRRWWLDRGGRDWTSVSFLVDRAGIVRYVHPGGQYVKGDGDYERIEAEIQKWLAKNKLE